MSERAAEVLRARDGGERRRRRRRHGRDRALRAVRPGAQPRRPLRLRGPARGGRLGARLRAAGLRREHARLQLVLPPAEAHVHAGGQRELVRARRLPRHGRRRQRSRRPREAASGGGRAARAGVGAARRSWRPSCSAAGGSRRTSARSPPAPASVLGVEQAEIELGADAARPRAAGHRTRSRPPGGTWARSTCRPTPIRASRCAAASCLRSRRCWPSPPSASGSRARRSRPRRSVAAISSRRRCSAPSRTTCARR